MSLFNCIHRRLDRGVGDKITPTLFHPLYSLSRSLTSHPSLISLPNSNPLPLPPAQQAREFTLSTKNIISERLSIFCVLY